MRGIGGGMAMAESSVGAAQPYHGGKGVAVGVGVMVGVCVAVGVNTIVGVLVGSAGRNGVGVDGAKGLAVTNGKSMAIAGGMLVPVGILQATMASRIRTIVQVCLGTGFLLVPTCRTLI
jgi:hypothetical protein